VHRARKAADAIAEHLDEAHHFQHQYENRNKVEDFLKSQHALDRDAEQRMKLREEIAKPPLRGSEPTRPIWGDLGSIAGGRDEFVY
jgi:spore cortex formation protein SpoVR/YcgB (stage V sporulation)